MAHFKAENELKWDISSSKLFRHELTAKMNRQEKAFQLINFPVYMFNHIERIVS